jgi:hypothetical protein
MSSLKNPHAMAYFQEAIAYYIAANKLREIMTTQPPSGLPLRDPTYFLYHHSAELTLKACLLPHGAKIRSRHNIVALFDGPEGRALRSAQPYGSSERRELRDDLSLCRREQTCHP